jgi:hypothetical protein
LRTAARKSYRASGNARRRRIAEIYRVVIERQAHPQTRAADAGLAINPNSATLHAARGLAEISIGDF